MLFHVAPDTLSARAETLRPRQTVSPGKAGLAWPNGPDDDTEQFRATAEITWFVRTLTRYEFR